MTILLTAASLQQGAAAIRDIATAIVGGLSNIPADEAALLDAAKLAAMIDPALAPIVVVLPIAEAILAWAIENNRSAEPGALNPIASGDRGSNPWREHEDDGA